MPVGTLVEAGFGDSDAWAGLFGIGGNAEDMPRLPCHEEPGPPPLPPLVAPEIALGKLADNLIQLPENLA